MTGQDRVTFRAPASPRAGAWRWSALGWISVLALVVLATGVTDADVRRDFAAVLVACAIVAPVFAVLRTIVLRRAQRELVVGLDAEGPYVRLGSEPPLRGPFRVERGAFAERLEAGVVSGSVAVLFVVIEGADGRNVAVRKALGAAFSAPPEWPRSNTLHALPYSLLEVERLPAALASAGIGAERAPR